MSAVPQTRQGYVSGNWLMCRDELQCSNGTAPQEGLMPVHVPHKHCRSYVTDRTQSYC